MSHRLLIEVSAAEADLIRDALERASGATNDNEEIDALREDLENLELHPGLVIDLRGDNPQVFSGRSLPVPVIVLRDTSATLELEPLHVNTLFVEQVTEALRIERGFAVARKLIADALRDLNSATIGLDANHGTAVAVIERLCKELEKYNYRE